ncbi:MAG: 1,4-alpha-glucan branching enzyme, partial [Elusimicrobia bacterium]|nr:1,4-alpha-glucan branching enzyme [Elusimicrobiota bacterium]
VVCNFTPVLRENFRVGVPREGYWREVLNSDGSVYGGCDKGNAGGRWAEPVPWNGRNHSVSLTLPPLGVVFFKRA